MVHAARQLFASGVEFWIDALFVQAGVCDVEIRLHSAQDRTLQEALKALAMRCCNPCCNSRPYTPGIIFVALVGGAAFLASGFQTPSAFNADRQSKIPRLRVLQCFRKPRDLAAKHHNHQAPVTQTRSLTPMMQTCHTELTWNRKPKTLRATLTCLPITKRSRSS